MLLKLGRSPFSRLWHQNSPFKVEQKARQGKPDSCCSRLEARLFKLSMKRNPHHITLLQCKMCTPLETTRGGPSACEECVTDLDFFSLRFPTVPSAFFPNPPHCIHDQTLHCIVHFFPPCFINSRGEAAAHFSSEDNLFVSPLMLANNHRRLA